MCIRVGEFIDTNDSSLFKIARCSVQKARVRFVNEEEEAMSVSLPVHISADNIASESMLWPQLFLN